MKQKVARYFLSEDATRDLDSILTYFEKTDPKLGLRTVRQLIHECDRLSRFDLGHPIEEWADPNFHFLFVKPFWLVYRPETRPLHVIRCLHEKRDIDQELHPQRRGLEEV